MKTSTAPGIETAKKLGLNEEEYKKIVEIMGRKPNFTELSIYSVMWSEHCSYKNSILWLKTLPREGGRLLVGAGEENAGLVELTDDIACAFKIESHNHPSALEPYQGAATGVGGIHRDIFTMGARPIAALNSLRFGDLTREHTRNLVRGVVKGIGDYGNCLGVPTVGGETFFHSCYNQNILVNAMSIGIVPKGETASAIADGPGNPVFIVGSATGKDGIHGATFASADLTDQSEKDLPAVQVGDPFQEKLLLEATLEAIATGAVVGIQDMGAAGITCSTSEMSAKSKTGMDIDLSKVPTRQTDMQAFEILLSESQERMLVIAEKGREDELYEIYDRWDLECVQIGEVTQSENLNFTYKEEMVAEVNADSLVLGGGAPVYEREHKKPLYLKEIEKFSLTDIEEPIALEEIALRIWSAPNQLSKKWIYEQYDHTVRTNYSEAEGRSDAAVVRLKGTKGAIVSSVDCNSTYVYADPYKGAMIAVAEAARNIVCSGGDPLAITNCLNFGNPYNPEVYYQFVQAVQGMGEACRVLNTPVTGGNVSFYNQTTTPEGNIPVYPTPVIGMIGWMEDLKLRRTIPFKNEGALIVLLGEVVEDIGSSEYLRVIHKIENSPTPWIEIEAEVNLQKIIKDGIREGLFQSIHDIAEGGLFCALMEKAVSSGMGFEIDPKIEIRRDAFYFGESQSRAVITVNESEYASLETMCKIYDVPCRKLGYVTKKEIIVDGMEWDSLERYSEIHYKTLEKIIDNL